MTWDAVVVGSGLGGLTTAAYLTTNGLRTLVLEQDDTIGGYTQVFRRKRKFEFDVGVHYVGECGPGDVVPTVLRGIGLEDRVEFNQLDPDGFTTITFPGFEFRVPAGWDNYRRRLLEAFPEERRGLGLCLAILARAAKELDRSGPAKLARNPLRAPLLATIGMMPLARLFDLCRLSPLARAVIVGESGDYSLPPSKAPVGTHAGFLNYYVKSGAFYPKGGGQVIAANLLDVIRSHGGTVRTQARVERILVEGGRAVGVQLAGGEVFRAPIVVSNADIKRTYLDLVGRQHLRRRTVRRVERFRMALPLVAVYLGLDIDIADRMPATQYWAHTSTDVEERYRCAYEGRIDPDAAMYVTSTTVKDPDNPHVAPPGHSVIELMAVMPPHHDFWRVGDGPAEGEKYGRNPEYLKMKETMADLLIDRAEALLPGLKEHIVWREASTPITHERYTLATDGACYGLECTLRQMGPFRPGPKTEIPGLYLAGGSTVWCMGVAYSMMGGVNTASAILGRDLREEVEAGRVFADPSRLPVHDEDWDPLMASRRLSHKPRSHRNQRPAVPA